MVDIIEMLNKINESTTRTNNILKSIIVKTHDDIDINSDDINKPIDVETLVDNNDIHLLLVTIKSGTTCVEHKHITSVECFFVISGILECCDDIYKSGDFITVPNNTEHTLSAPDGDCVLMIMSIPPEYIYTS